MRAIRFDGIRTEVLFSCFDVLLREMESIPDQVRYRLSLEALKPGFWLGQSLRPSARKRRKTLGDDPIYLAPERHDEISDTVEPFPSPGIELSRLAVA